MIRKPVIVFLTTILVIALMSGCGGGDSSESSNKANKTPVSSSQEAASKDAEPIPAKPVLQNNPLTGNQVCALGIEEFHDSFNIYKDSSTTEWWSPLGQTDNLGGRFFQKIGPALYMASGKNIMKYTEAGLETIGILDKGQVRCLGEYDGDLVVAGNFSAVNQTPASNIAILREQNWESLGGTFDDGQINTITGYNNGILVGGNFKKIQGKDFCGLALWSGGVWSTLGQPLGSPTQSFHAAKVKDFLVSGDRVFVAGGFYISVEEFDRLQPRVVMELVDGKWKSPSTNVLTARPECLEVYEGELLVGGTIHSAYDRMDSRGERLNEVQLNGIAVLRDGKWQPFGLEFNSEGRENATVNSLLACGPKLFIAGDFNFTNGEPVPGTLCWNSLSVSVPPVSDGVGLVTDLTPFMGGVILGGLNQIWVDDSVINLAVGLGDEVHDIILSMNTLFAAHGRGKNKTLSRWDGSQWERVSDVGGQRFYPGEDGFYAIGKFDSIDGIPAIGVARFDGNAWSALGEGLGVWKGEPVPEFTAGEIGSVGSYHGELVAFGDFSHSGENFVGPAAVFRSGKWEPLVQKDVWDAAIACWNGIVPSPVLKTRNDVGRPFSQLFLREATSMLEFDDNLLLLISDGGYAQTFYKCMSQTGTHYSGVAVLWDGTQFLPVEYDPDWNDYTHKYPAGTLCLFNGELLVVKKGSPCTINHLSGFAMGDEAYPDYLDGPVRLDTYQGQLFVGTDQVFQAEDGQLSPLFNMPDDMYAYKMVAHENVLYVLAHNRSNNNSSLMARAWR